MTRKAGLQRRHMRLGIRLAAGTVFIVFGIGKFTRHGSELAAFRGYGLPWPELFVVAVGAVELVGGALLLAGWLPRITALMLAGDMMGAILVSGLARGETVSLTLAPLLLLGMAFLLRSAQLEGGEAPNGVSSTYSRS